MSTTCNSENLAQESGEFINIAAYKFVAFEQLEERRQTHRRVVEELGLKGTILLSPEGINLFIAGSRQSIDQFLLHLRSDPLLADIAVKESVSGYQPFNRMLVKIKQEICFLTLSTTTLIRVYHQYWE